MRIERLKRILESVIGYSLDVENLGCIADVAIELSCETLSRACVYFTLKQYKAVQKTEGWKQMMPATKEYLAKASQAWDAGWKFE
jgi:hypothetical protein